VDTKDGKCCYIYKITISSVKGGDVDIDKTEKTVTQALKGYETEEYSFDITSDPEDNTNDTDDISSVGALTASALLAGTAASLCF